jgi:drug/metabolite transporter (DMT)-like permease
MVTPRNRPHAGSRHIPRTIEWGIGLALLAAAISGLAIFLNAYAVKQLPDPAVYTTLKNGVAAVILVALALAGGSLRSAAPAIRRQWRMVLAVGVVGGSVPFVLFFSGLAQASAPSAAFIQKTLFIWVAFLAVPLLGERLGMASIAGMAILLAGQAMVLPPDGVRWGAGETMILVATLMWAVETVLVRRLLAAVPAGAMAALRMGIGLVVLVAYLAATGKLAVVATLGPGQLGWALLTGLILAGYVGTWFASLERAPASIVTSVLVLGAVVTGALTTLSRGAAPSPFVVGGYVLITVAAFVLAAWAIRTARRLGSARLAVERAAG